MFGRPADRSRPVTVSLGTLLLEPGTYAVDEAEHGHGGRVVGTFVFSPGDVRGTWFVHELVSVGGWSLDGSSPCMACEECGAVVASQTDDCQVPKDTRPRPGLVVTRWRAGG